MSLKQTTCGMLVGALALLGFDDRVLAGSPSLIMGSEVSPGDEFGDDIAMDGEWLFIGAPGDGALGEDAGAVYVFRNVNGTWVEWQILRSDQGAMAAGDLFGDAVDVDGDHAAVGASRDVSVPFDPMSGRVFVYSLIDDEWVMTDQMGDPGGGNYEHLSSEFGREIALQWPWMIVGAPWSSAIYFFDMEQESALVESHVMGDRSTIELLSPPNWTGDSISMDGDLLVYGSWGANWLDLEWNGAGTIQANTLVNGQWNFSLSRSGASLCDSMGKRVAVKGDVVLAWAPGAPMSGCDKSYGEIAPNPAPPTITSYYKSESGWVNGPTFDEDGPMFAISNDERPVFAYFHSVLFEVRFIEFVEGAFVERGVISTGFPSSASEAQIAFSATDVFIAFPGADEVIHHEIDFLATPLADINGDGVVNGEDIASLLAVWGSNEETADLNGDGIVNGADLAQLLAAWTG